MERKRGSKHTIYGRFFLDTGRGGRRLGNALYIDGLKEPACFTPERLADIAKTSSSPESRIRAVRKLHVMQFEIASLIKCQHDLMLKIEKKKSGRQRKYVVRYVDRDDLPVDERNRVSETERFLSSCRGRIRKAMEDIALFGNYADQRDAVLILLAWSKGGLESLRRAFIDSNFEDTRARALNCNFLLGDRMYPTEETDEGVEEKIENIEDLQAMRKIIRVAVENLRILAFSGWHEDHIDDETELMNILNRSDPPTYLLRLTNLNDIRDFLQDHVKGDIPPQLGKGGRHGADPKVYEDIIDHIRRNNNYEGLASIIMRRENKDDRFKATKALFESYGNQNAKRWAYYAAVRCTDQYTAQNLLDRFMSRRDFTGISMMAAYSKGINTRRQAIFLVKRNKDELRWIASHSNFEDNAESAFKLFRSLVRNEPNYAKQMKRMLKRRSPFIPKHLLEELRKERCDGTFPSISSLIDDFPE